ncbi:MAG: hypothetical protein FWE85_05460 [Clostridiales bacterium]|nr:hypothetical protein [Clostridiales bacterium]
MNNVAYTDEYQKDRAEYEDQLFRVAAFVDEEHHRLTDELTRKTKNFFWHQEDYAHHPCSQNEIINSSGDILYSYSSVDSSAGFCKVFAHSNGKEYAVFSRELYGYSVLDLSSMQDFHYIPAESFAPFGEMHGETFIWCDVHYNRQNNLLAVEGCFWAYPYSVLLVDFTNPMQDAPQIDVNGFINKDPDDYVGIDFAAWDNTDLVLSVYGEDGVKITVKQEEYLEWFKNAV